MLGVYLVGIVLVVCISGVDVGVIFLWDGEQDVLVFGVEVDDGVVDGEFFVLDDEVDFFCGVKDVCVLCCFVVVKVHGVVGLGICGVDDGERRFQHGRLVVLCHRSFYVVFR